MAREGYEDAADARAGRDDVFRTGDDSHAIYLIEDGDRDRRHRRYRGRPDSPFRFRIHCASI
jgi:hypothetical protein